MAGRILALTTLLFMLTACRQEQLSLPITDAASSSGSEIPGPAQKSRAGLRRTTEETYEPAPEESCYSFILLRPKDQRAAAVQARLKQADRMAAAFDAHLVSVDIIGDHANILSLQFPTVWPAKPSYSDRVSSVVEDYFSSPDIEDYMCNSGFAEVRLSAWGRNDRRIHPLWKARVTSEGLLRITPEGEQVAVSDTISPH